VNTVTVVLHVLLAIMCVYSTVPNDVVSCSTSKCRWSFHAIIEDIQSQLVFLHVVNLCFVELILELILLKCLQIRTYWLEVCALPKRELQFLDFTVNRVLMKLFKSSNIAVIEQCHFFHTELPSVQLQRRFFGKCCWWR